MARILILVNHPVQDGSARYRIYQFLPYLEAASHKCTVRPFSTDTLFRALRGKAGLATKIAHTAFCSVRRAFDLLRAGRFDLVVIHREAFPFLAPRVEQAAIRRSRRTLFSFDDAIHIGHQSTDTLAHPWLYRMKYGSGFDQVTAACDHVLVGNEFLAAYARPLNPNVTVMPTVVDLRNYQYRPRKLSPPAPVTVGWYGSNSTSGYLQEVQPALAAVAAANPGRVRFRMFGDTQLQLDLPNLEVLPFRLEAEIEDLSSIDIGIMPMPDTPWTRGKCSFKAIQYMALGTPSIVSPVGMARDVVSRGVNGFWATKPPEWTDALQRLISDPALYQRFSVEARRTVEQHYSLQVWGPRFAALITELAAAQPTHTQAARA